MASLPVEILFGVYLGLLVGIIPALISWALGFTFKYVTGVTLPGFGMLVLAIALAGVNGGLLALADPTFMQTPNAPRVATAVLVVGMLALFAHSKGDQMGASVPRRLSLSGLRSKHLSRDLAEFIGGGDEVRVRVVGEVADMEGYPPLPDDLRAEIRAAELTFPADLRVEELEERMAARLRTEYDLGDVSVTIDERGRATVVAAPSFSGLSKRVAEDRHAVSVDALVPTGLARGDEVTVVTPDAQVRGTVVSARSGPDADGSVEEERVDPTTPADAESEDDGTPTPVRAPTTTGGEGRLTVAVTRADVQPLLRAGEAKVVVESRGTRREYEVVSLLRRANKRFRRFTVRAGGLLDGQPLGTAGLRETYGVAVLAARTGDGWTFAPDGTTTLGDGDELFAVGARDALDAFGSALDGTEPRGGD